MFTPHQSSSNQFSTQHSYGLARKKYAIPFAAGAHESAPRGSLISRQVVTTQAIPPKRSQAAMRRSRHGIFVNAGCGSKKSRYIVVPGGGSAARDDHGARLQLPNSCKIRAKRSQDFFIFHFHQ